MPSRLRGFCERRARALFARVWQSGTSELRRDLAGTVTRGFERLTYERLRDNRLKPDAIIDVGANRGGWTRMVRPIFPSPPILMIEAQSALEGDPIKTCRETSQVTHRTVLLGSSQGEERSFYEMGTGSSLLPENSTAERKVAKLTTTTLDAVAGSALPSARAIFLKLDIQGAELLVLSGGEETLKRCAAVQLEVALLPYNAGVPLLADVAADMVEREFLATEVAGFSRPGDHLVQVDAIFARSGSPLRPDFFTF